MNFFRAKKNRSISAASDTKLKAKNDVILTCAILFVALAAALGLFLFRKAGDTVTVTIDGKTFGEYSLSENRTVEIKSDNGYNLLVIENGKAYVSEASCPDGICSSHRPVGNNGESIICLPNKVVVEIHAKAQNEPDIIA